MRHSLLICMPDCPTVCTKYLTAFTFSNLKVGWIFILLMWVITARNYWRLLDHYSVQFNTADLLSLCIFRYSL